MYRDSLVSCSGGSPIWVLSSSSMLAWRLRKASLIASFDLSEFGLLSYWASCARPKRQRAWLLLLQGGTSSCTSSKETGREKKSELCHMKHSWILTVTLWIRYPALVKKKAQHTLSCMSRSSWQGVIEVWRIRAVRAWHLFATRDCLSMPVLAWHSLCWVSLCSRAKWASSSTHSSCLLTSPRHTHWLTLWVLSIATLKQSSTETRRQCFYVVVKTAKLASTLKWQDFSLDRTFTAEMSETAR